MANDVRGKRTVADAIGKRRVIESRMRKNLKLIHKYSQGKLYFDKEVDQCVRIDSLTQANEDLFNEALKLTQVIEKTNAQTNVTTEDGQILRVSDLTFYKRQSRKKDRKKNPSETRGFVNLLLQSYQMQYDWTISGIGVTDVSRTLKVKNNQKIDHLINFLDWIDDELNEVNHITRLCE